MKKLLMVTAALSLIVSVLSSDPALALTGKDNWKSIRSSRDVLIQQPSFAEVFGDQGLFNACATEDEFRSRTPVKTCLNNGCSDFEIRNIVVNRVYNANVCVKFAPMSATSSGECVDFDVVTAVYPTSFQLPVIEANGEQSGDYVFSKNYSIPACE